MIVNASIKIELSRIEAEKLVYAMRSVVEDSLRNYNYEVTPDIETTGALIHAIAEALEMKDVDKNRYRRTHSSEYKEKE